MIPKNSPTPYSTLLAGKSGGGNESSKDATFLFSCTRLSGGECPFTNSFTMTRPLFSMIFDDLIFFFLLASSLLWA
jgi:hypothetical protein